MITKAVNVMNEFYNENPLKKSENPYGQSPMSMDDIDMTRSGFSGDTPRSDPGMLSQNGHTENGGGTQSPAINGTSKEEKELLLKEEADGSSDKQLKEAANDPATHEEGSYPNGMSDIVATTEILHKQSPKRKLRGEGEEPAAKKVKTDAVYKTTSSSTGNGSKEAKIEEGELEEGEEGELAE